MKYYTVIFLLCAACASQTRQAFTPRPPAEDYGSLTPNTAQKRALNLRRALNLATERQEAADGLFFRCLTLPATDYRQDHIVEECTR